MKVVCPERVQGLLYKNTVPGFKAAPCVRIFKKAVLKMAF